jgi:hypothetical protein
MQTSLEKRVIIGRNQGKNNGEGFGISIVDID